MIDYHVHTPLCNHAHGSMESFILQAVNMGLTEICFLDHLTIRSSGMDLSMSTREIPFYLQAARVLQQKYKKIIKIKTGLEIDFNPESVQLVLKAIDPFSFDMIASSVHFLGNINLVSRRNVESNKNLDFNSLCDQYLTMLAEMMEYDYFDMVCHMDVVKKFGRPLPPWFEKKINVILSKIKYKGLSIEINTSGLDHPCGQIYPGWNLVKECIASSIPMTIGSDAHKPEDLGRHFKETIARLKSMGASRIAAYTERERYAVPIDEMMKNKNK